MNTNHLINKILQSLLFITAFALLNACSVEVGGNEDKTKPSVALTSLNSGEEIIGDFTITWTTDETNKSTVDIHLSYDSGKNYNNSDTVVINEPDTGSFVWKTNNISTLNDCRTCRISITPTDVVGNIGEAAISQQDFIINNIPQVLGSAFYTDVGNDGPGAGDTINVPFDKDIELLTAIASDIFFFPVLGDSIGPFATVAKGFKENELIITFNDIIGSSFHLHVRDTFKTDKLALTQPSGLNILDNLAQGILVAKDTARTAAPSPSGIDIAPTFNDATNAELLAATDNTFSIALGDIDGDGDLDLVMGNIGEANRVWRNDGKGVFTEINNPALLAVNSNTLSIALGDIDGDGDLDIVTGNLNEANRVWRNDGSGVFTIIPNAAMLAVTNNTFYIALGDIDNDEVLDIVTGNAGEANRVWRNDGSGVFTDTTNAAMLADIDTTSIALGDVDRDGDLDLVTGGLANRVWLNDTRNPDGSTGLKGEFFDTNQMLGSSNTNSIVLGDVDSDGHLDMVTGNSGEANHVWRNNGVGVFTDITNSALLAVDSNTSSIALKDIDGDGDLDLVTGNVLSMANRVWSNNGAGVFTDSSNTALLADVSNTYAIALGDVDGDGDLDLVTGNSIIQGEANRVWLNSLVVPTSGFLEIKQAFQTTANGTSPIALGDVDSDVDGNIDIVTHSRGEADHVWSNNGSGIFTEITNAALLEVNSSTNSFALGDIDGDGDLDLVTGNSGEANRVWLNNGTGIFAEITNATLLAAANNTFAIALGNVDGDVNGNIDLVTGNFGQANRVWSNNGDGLFIDITNTELQAATNNTRSIALGDIDNDDDLDIVTGNNEANRVWSNNGTGVFTDTTNAAMLADIDNTTSIALGDVDGDGDLDLVTGGSASRVWLNDTRKPDGSTGLTGEFFDTNQALGSSITASIALGDLDGDGDLDLVTGNLLMANRVWSNNGAGFFTDTTNPALLAGTEATASIALGDIDGDGDLDLVVGNTLIGGIQVWLNDF